jgi:FixJ family two-component response regulator
VKRTAHLVSVIDDDASLRRSVTNLLQSVGFVVETFASAESFLQDSKPEDTGCLILDVRLDGMSGLDLLSSLRARGSRIPVVMLTVHSDQETHQDALARGAVAFMAKPFRAEVLIDTVRTALGLAAR